MKKTILGVLVEVPCSYCKGTVVQDYGPVSGTQVMNCVVCSGKKAVVERISLDDLRSLLNPTTH